MALEAEPSSSFEEKKRRVRALIPHLLGGINLEGEHQCLPKDGSVVGFSQPSGHLCKKKKAMQSSKGGGPAGEGRVQGARWRR